MEFQTVHKAYLNVNKALSKYGDNGFMLWCIALKYPIEDVDIFAYENLTDGADDKKCDLLWVNRDDGFAIIAQGCYKSSRFSSGQAPANKASDLNAAISWVLGSEELNKIPKIIRSGVANIRNALQERELSTIYIDYYHNLPESVNVKNELQRVHETASKFLEKQGISNIGIECREIGQESIIDWYLNSQNTILVTDEIKIPFSEGYEIKTGKWSAWNTVLPARMLYNWFRTFGEKLFSANQRNYLGRVRSDTNINYGIKQSAMEQPNNFFAFHNGITCLVNNYENVNDELHVLGISIVNGAQTTGAIGNLEEPPSDNVQVPCRFIKCSDPKLIQSIVLYNNSQNKMIPSDFRSTDSIQKRLVAEFENYQGEINYSGGRRGGATDAISRDPNLLSSDKVAQSLTAFHGRPDIAYLYKSRIWKDNTNYDFVFKQKTTAKHIILVTSLYLSIVDTYNILKKKAKDMQELSNEENEQLDFLSRRGSAYLSVYAISKGLETLIDKPISDRFLLEFDSEYDLEECKMLWRPVILTCLRLNHLLVEALDKYSFTMDDVEEPIKNFLGILGSLVQTLNESKVTPYSDFRDKILISEIS